MVGITELRAGGWRGVALAVGVCLASVSTARAQEEAAPAAPVDEGVEVEVEEAAPPGTPQVTPRYVVWRIKAGTGAGALAPRLERRLRREMTARLGGEVLSKAAQTGILLIRPELADCDGNLPCALEVGDALHIRFVVGGEAVAGKEASVTAWVIDLDTGKEVKRVQTRLEGEGEPAEQAAVAALADGLLQPPKLAEPKPAAVVAEDEGGGRPPVLGAAVLATSAVLGVLGVLTLGAGAGALGSAAMFQLVRQQTHTQRARVLSEGSLLAAGALVAVGLVLAGFAVPAAILGGVSMVLRP
ncbi:MAG: hypothetical protein AB2A00_20020 [Myxococcota bacterium]